MSKLTDKEIEQLQQQLKEKTEEIKVIYDKLAEAGEIPLSDDILDTIAGGVGGFGQSSTGGQTTIPIFGQ